VLDLLGQVPRNSVLGTGSAPANSSSRWCSVQRASGEGDGLEPAANARLNRWLRVFENPP
jgi:hypothetical protein